MLGISYKKITCVIHFFPPTKLYLAVAENDAGIYCIFTSKEFYTLNNRQD